MIYIYKLIHPKTKKVVYVGQTIDIPDRHLQHKTIFKQGHGFIPQIEIIEECDDDKASEREIYWIQKYDSDDLLNRLYSESQNHLNYKYRNIKILEADYRKIKKWAFIRDMKIYEIISLLVKK